jgi:hypothetical protein
VSGKRQSGFKRNPSCVNAIFMSRFSTDYLNSNGSTVYLTSLNIKKAFGSVAYDKLFARLENAGLIEIIVNWGNCFSHTFAVLKDTCQECYFFYSVQCLINFLIVQLRKLNVRSVVRLLYTGCSLHADNISLLCPITHGLQC